MIIIPVKWRTMLNYQVPFELFPNGVIPHFIYLEKAAAAASSGQRSVSLGEL